MSTFSDSAARSSIRQRVERLTPEAQRKWGRMTPHQMVCHLNDAYKMSLGERQSSMVDNFFSRSVMRWVALHTSMKWPPGIKTVPEADQERHGTQPVGWDRDHGELLGIIDRFTPAEGRPHPIFGALTAEEWSIWAYRHADHHLRQFSL